MDPIYHFAPNPFPAHLREELPYPSAPWLVSRELFKRLAAAPEIPGKYKKIELQPDDPEAMFVQRYYEQNPPHGKGIRRIYVIHSGYQTEMFEAELRKCEQEAIRFRPNWSRESEAEHRDEAYAEWQQIADQFTPLEIATARRIDQIIHARVLPLWHGTSHEIAESICESGFTFFGKHHLFDPNAKEGKFASTDAGYFGSGIYFTDSPSYAAKYSKENILMLAFIAMRTPFPIVGDVPHPVQCSDMRRFTGKELYQEYNAHFVPISPITPGSMQYYPCQFEQPECNEYVIKMPSQTLARYQVEIGDSFPLFQAMITQGKNNLPLPKRRIANEVTSEVLIEKLRTHYKAICTDLPLPMSEATFPLKELFTQLVILESKLVEQKEKETQKQGTEKQDKEKRENSSRDPSLPERDSLAEAMAHLQETTTPIAMEDLFAKNESAKEPKKVLLIGRAGIGKTTLIDRITLGWTEGKMFLQFNAVFRLVLRELNDFQEPSQNLYWLASAISHAIYKDRDQFHDVLAYIQQHQSRILILLDGLDEASPELIQKVDQLLQMDLHILISSRPGVPAAIKNRTDRQIENTGFSKTQMEEYAAKFFARVSSDPNQTTPFLNAIRNHHNLLSLAHTPLQLQMLCTLWETGAKDKGFGSSLTVLYTEMFMQLYLWHVRKQNPYADTSDLSIDQKLIEGLGKVALAGLEARQLMLSEATLKDALQGTVVTIAQLRATGLLKKSGKDYTFFHLTFQEYLIAYYVSLLSSKDQWDFIRANRYKPHYRLVMSFLAGHIYQADCTKEKAKTKHYFETLFSGEVDLAGYVQLELTLRSAAECPSIYDWVNHTFGAEEALRKLLTVYLKIENEVYSDEILKNLSQLCLFSKRHPDSDWLTDDLKKMYYDQMDDKRVRAPRVIASLASILHIDDEILRKIHELLTDRDWQVREAAAQALGIIGAHGMLDEATISKIFELLANSNWEMGRAAAQALETIGAHGMLDETMISKIAGLLTYGDCDVKINAAKALGNIGSNVKLDEVIISKIIVCLTHYTRSVRETAKEALRKIRANVKCDEVIISQLVEFLSHKNTEVRQIVTEELGEMAKSVMLDEQTISKIAECLKDTHLDVRNTALQAIRKIGMNVRFDERIIFKLVEFLTHKEGCVRIATTIVLENIVKNVKLDKEIISKIVALLDHSDWEVRHSAVFVLGAIGTSTRLDEETVCKITNLLTDSSQSVRDIALKVIGKIGVSQNSDETIAKIAGLLTDSERMIREEAAEILGKIGESKKINKTIVSEITELLTHNDGYVRDVAGEVLRKIGTGRKLDETIVSEIAQLLAHSKGYVPKEALRVLVKIGASAKLDRATVSKIAELLANSDRELRYEALEALGKIGANAKLDRATVYRIAEFLTDSEGYVRKQAIRVLGNIVTNAKLDQATVSKIAEFLADSESQARYEALEALGKIGTNEMLDRAIISNIAVLLDDSDCRMRDAAAQVLGKIAVHAMLDEATISRIAKFLTYTKKSVRNAALKALGNIAANVKLDAAIISKIVECSVDYRPEVRATTAKVLGNIVESGRFDAKIISKIAELLDDSDTDVRSTAATAIGNIAAHGMLDEAIIFKIAELLADSDELVRLAAATAIGNIGENVKLDGSIISKIAELLAHRDWHLREAALEVLGKIGASGKLKLNETIIFKIAKLLMFSENKKDVVLESLAKILTNMKLNERIIFQLLTSQNDFLQDAAKHILGYIGANERLDEAAISKINVLLSHSESDVRKAAAHVLGEIPLFSFVKHSFANATTLLDQAFLRQTVTCLEKRQKKTYLVILEKAEETRIPLANPKAFIEIANQSSFAGSFVRRYSNNRHFEQLTFFKEETKKNNDCSIQ